MMSPQEDVVIPPSPRVPLLESVEATEQPAPPAPKKQSELAAAGALFVVLLSAMSLVFGAITLVMF